MEPLQNKQTPVVSVVIVSWNARSYLEQCLASLTSQVCRYPMEIIVVDNDSSDGSPECVEQNFPEVQLIRSGGNLGFAKGNNLGIARASGRYLALINSDVRVLANCLTGLVDYCAAHPEIGMVGPRVIGGDGKLQRSCRGFPSLWNMSCQALGLSSLFPRVRLFSGYPMTYWAQENEAAVDILSGCFWLIRREAMDQVGLLDDGFFMYGEDMDWCRRFWKAGWKLAFVPSCEAIHYGGASSANSPVRFYIEMQRADLRYWRKHHSRAAVAGYFMLSCLRLALRAVGYVAVSWVARARRDVYRYKVKRSVACLKWMFSKRMPV